MTDAPRPRLEGGEGDMSLAPRATGAGPAAADGEHGDYRESLRSRRWNAAPLANPEVAPTDPRIAVAFIAGLCALTFVLLVAGYWTGFWG